MENDYYGKYRHLKLEMHSSTSVTGIPWSRLCPMRVSRLLKEKDNVSGNSGIFSQQDQARVVYPHVSL